MFLLIITSVIIIATSFLYYYHKVTKDYGSFRSKGVAEEPASFPFGSKIFWNLYLFKSHMVSYADGLRKKYPNDKFVIAWDKGKPAVVVFDAELARLIMVKDFETFPLRKDFSLPGGESNKYLKNMITVINDVDKWKAIRSILSPGFTSGKIKAMLPLIYETADELLNYVESIDKTMVDARDLMYRSTLQSIAKAGFGVQGDCFEIGENNSKFMKQIQNLNSTSLFKKIIMMFIFFFIPKKFVHYFSVSFINEETQSFFIGMIKSSIKSRKEENLKRGDFVDLVLSETEKSQEENVKTFESKFEEDAKIVKSQTKFEKDELELYIISNIFVLLFAGFETTTSVLSNLMIYLANNPDIQDKLFNTISDAISENNDDENLDFYKLQDMKYLENCIHETIRSFPLIQMERESVRKYKIPDTDIIMNPGTSFLFPNDAFNKSEKYFNVPEEFNPERFQEDDIFPYAYTGFGHGPRNCVGKRLALLILKAIISRLIFKYKVKRNEKTVSEFKVEKSHDFNLRVDGGTWISLEKRK